MSNDIVTATNQDVIADDDQRPPIWTGHMFVTCSDAEVSSQFYQTLGMRLVLGSRHGAVLEMRGGTHLVLARPDAPMPADVPGVGSAAASAPGPAPFDLMVDDLPACHDRWAAVGLTVTPITRNLSDVHDVFTVTDPDGRTILVHDSHVVGPV